MKAKEGFVLRIIADEYILMPVGDNITKFKGSVLLNEVSAFVWKKMREETSKEEILTAVTNEFEVERELAARDIDALLIQLTEYGVIDI